MSKTTNIAHPIINSYLEDFIVANEISDSKAKDKHTVFEQFINNLILTVYSNDPSITYEDVETGTSFGIDGLAIFVADKVVTSVEDVDLIIDSLKKFDVSFIFTQIKTSDNFERTDISDFLAGIRRFFNFTKCEITELQEQWEVAKYIYSKSSKFKKPATLMAKYISLSPREINLSDPHLSSAIDMGISDLNEMNIFSPIKSLDFMGIKEIMMLYEKISSGLEVSVTISKQPVPYPKDNNNKIKNAYYGLIKLDEFIEILTEVVSDERILRKRIFNDNIRYYLGSNEKNEVNSGMKEQLMGNQNYLFGLLNNGITVIADSIAINSEDLTLTNYQIVNGCQTSNVIFECLDSISDYNDIYLPLRLISTEDEDTKNSIIKATNSQTQLKPEQLIALTPIQKALEQYYATKSQNNSCALYYERRTEQYRDENIPKAKIINIPFQIKATSALFFDLPHAVSGQYGKVEKQTRGLLFDESHLAFLNSYYVSGLAWYRTERFVQNNEDGKKYRRARWHIMMIMKYICCDFSKIETSINKKSDANSSIIERVLLDEEKSNILLANAISIIENSIDYEALSDRKTFERKETTNIIIEYIKNNIQDIIQIQQTILN